MCRHEAPSGVPEYLAFMLHCLERCTEHCGNKLKKGMFFVMETTLFWAFTAGTLGLCILYTSAASIVILKRLKIHRMNIIQLEDQIRRRLETTAKNHEKLHDATLRLHKEVNAISRRDRKLTSTEK